MCFYRQIIKKAADWLIPDGYLVIGIGETQANSIIKLLESEGHYGNIEISNDLQEKERVISAMRK